MGEVSTDRHRVDGKLRPRRTQGLGGYERVSYSIPGSFRTHPTQRGQGSKRLSKSSLVSLEEANAMIATANSATVFALTICTQTQNQGRYINSLWFVDLKDGSAHLWLILIHLRDGPCANRHAERLSRRLGAWTATADMGIVIANKEMSRGFLPIASIL